jgi:protein-S-isoprenylcysteine O-methyltransferase Ste14
MDLDAFVRAFLAVYFTMVAVRYTFSALGRHRRTGESRIHDGAPRSRARALRLAFNVFRTAIWVVCVARALVPSLDRLLGVVAAPVVAPLLGVALLVASLAAVEYVHAYMDRDWRSGVPSQGLDALLTEGPFAVSRHPTFLAILAGQIGLALALPSLFTLVCLLVGAAVIVLQAGVEERALRTRFGARWDRYAEATPRWLPRPARLALAARSAKAR